MADKLDRSRLLIFHTHEENKIEICKKADIS